MRKWMAACMLVTAPVLVASAGVPARAQLMNSLKNAAGMGQNGASGSTGGGLGGLGGGMSMPSVGSASSGNIAGVLRYCVQNNYLGGGNGASSVENQLTSKLGSRASDSDPQYASGEQGTLQTGNGQGFSLGGGGSGGNGGGLKAQLTQKVCAQVLKHAKSLL